MPSKANQFNKYSNCSWRATWQRKRQALLLRQLILPIKVVASYVGLWKVPLQQAHDPSFLTPLVLHVLAKSLFRL